MLVLKKTGELHLQEKVTFQYLIRLTIFLRRQLLVSRTWIETSKYVSVFTASLVLDIIRLDLFFFFFLHGTPYSFLGLYPVNSQNIHPGDLRKSVSELFLPTVMRLWPLILLCCV